MKIFLVSCVFLVAAINIALACECGLEGATSRIFKGTRAKANKYPWLAQIRTAVNRESGHYNYCGGTLIDNQHVVTAARCVTNIRKNKPQAVPIGDFDLYLGRVKSNDNTPPIGVTDVFFDNRYDPKDASFDFAILTLERPVKFTSQIAPICLPHWEGSLTKLQIAGWGATAAGAVTTQNDALLEAEIDLLSYSECMKVKNDYITNTLGQDGPAKPVVSSHLCAVNRKSKADSCNGDFGGPLMHKGPNGSWYLMGISSSSWGACGSSPHIASLYTRTITYPSIIKERAPGACYKN